jgi:ubiquinone biosynthesis protein
MGVALESVNRKAFVRDLEESVDAFYASAGQGLSFGEIFHQFIRLTHRHQIGLPREFLRVAKAFMAIEDQARSLDPDFNMLGALQAYAPRMLGGSILPDRATMRGMAAAGYRALSELRFGLPDALANAMRLVRHGDPKSHLRHDEFEELVQHIDRASNRLSFSLIIAAVIVGSSIVMAFHSGSHFEGIPAPGLSGLVVAALLGLWWAVAMLRLGKL